jgi:hypothetical protein
LMIPIKKWDRMLTDELDAAQSEFDGKCFLIDGLQKTRAKLAMNPDRSSDYLIRDFRIP